MGGSHTARNAAARAIVWLAATFACLGWAPAAGAATATQLLLSQSAAFSILGHSCGGIQEQVYATGFDPRTGYPTGNVYMQTRCGGSGRGGGYKTTTYSAWATVTWDWFGDTRAFAALEGAAEGSTTFSAEDAYGDRIYDTGTAAFLETGEPPLTPPAPPTGVTAELSSIEAGEEEEDILRFLVSWTLAPDASGLITSSTVTATPVGSAAPVLSATVAGPASSAIIQPLNRHTTYLITVTSTDAEGTSAQSSPLEASSTATGPPPATETCEVDRGTIKLSPGLNATPQVQSVTVKGTLEGCHGGLAAGEARYVAHLTSSAGLSCSVLDSLPAEQIASESLLLKWSPGGAGDSTGTLLLPLSELGGALGGSLEGGPLPESLSLFAASVGESFRGGPTCGVPPVGKTAARPVRKGTFAGAQVEIGG